MPDFLYQIYLLPFHVFLTFQKSLGLKQQAICHLLKNVKIIHFDQFL